MRSLKNLIIALLLIIAKIAYPIDENHTLSFAGAGDIWINDNSAGHGIFLVHYSYKPNRDDQFYVYYNTDTLVSGFDYKITDYLVWGSHLKGELFLAGLLSDYYKNGEIIKSGGFKASFIEFQTYFAVYLSSKNSLRLTIKARKWYFRNNDNTGADFTLPADIISYEPKISYVYWNVKNDVSINEVHRFFQRIEGLTFGIALGLETRSEVNQWGFLTNSEHRNNDPNKTAINIKQWIYFGIPVKKIMRISLKQTFYYSNGTDDIFNVRIGGLNPYVVQVAGLPWASFISCQHVTSNVFFTFLIFGESELSIVYDFVYLKDISRTGSKDWDTAMGLSLHLDMRLKSWQIDLKAGYAIPFGWMSNKTHFSFFVALGKKFSL